LSKFLIQSGQDFEVVAMTRNVMSQMLKCLSDEYEIHGYGKANVQGVESVARNLHRWIEITDVKTGFTDGDCYIIVYFKR